MDPPKDNAVYRNVEYWDGRFEHEDQYEWLASYKDVRHLITEVVKRDDRVLIVGCGNSRYVEVFFPKKCPRKTENGVACTATKCSLQCNVALA